jgi:DNA modification methylase
LQWNHRRESTSSELVLFKGNIWQRYLQQIEESKTLKRAHYYVERLRRGVSESKVAGCNDLNLYRWQEYDEILTDSLWLLDKRDRSGVHNAGYWGNFVPQIPQQLLSRYTKAGEWVLDPFLGSGTTLIECQRMGRNALGVELQEEVAAGTSALIEAEDNPEEVKIRVAVGDSRTFDHGQRLAAEGVSSVQFVMLHPPYHDIIRFSQDQRCLSNAASLQEFLEGFREVSRNALKVLDKGRFLAIVIGDKYSGSEWVPLGFQCMQVAESLGCILKSIVVKNFEATAGKRQTSELWRYRALAGGFYVFKHEYIFVMQKA